MAISRQKETRSRHNALLLFRMTSRFIYIAQYHRQHCTLYMPFNSLKHLCTITMTNNLPARDLNLVPPGYKPQSIRVSTGAGVCHLVPARIFSYELRYIVGFGLMEMSNLKPTIYRNLHENMGLSDVTILLRKLRTLNIAMIMTMYS